jgi:hypothetical protein
MESAPPCGAVKMIGRSPRSTVTNDLGLIESSTSSAAFAPTHNIRLVRRKPRKKEKWKLVFIFA